MDILTLANGAKSALKAITQPTEAAIDALVDEANQELASSQTALSAKQAELEAVKATDAATIADLQAKLATVQTRSILPGCGDMNLHSNWELKPGKEDNIGAWTEGTTFKLTTPTDPKGNSTGMKFEIAPVAGGWSDALCAVHRRIVPAAARIWLEGVITPDANTLTATQCLEIDTIVTKSQKHYNLSSQINYSKGGLLQVAHPTGGWWDTPVVIGKLSATPHTFIWEYVLDTVKQTHSYISFTLDGKRYLMPAQFQNLTPIVSTWSDGIHLQLQIDANNKGVGFAVVYDKLNYYVGAI